MFKIAGACFIIFACYAYSKIKIGEIKQSIEFCDGLMAGFVVLEEQICGLLLPVGKAVINCVPAAGDAGNVFASAAEMGGSAYEMFSHALRGYGEYSDVLLPYISGITALEEEERRCAFSFIRTRLCEMRKRMYDEQLRLDKLYGAAGIPIGILIVILLY